MKKYKIQVLLIAVLYFGFSSGNKSWNTWEWSIDSCVFFIIAILFIIVIPVMLNYLNGHR